MTAPSSSLSQITQTAIHILSQEMGISDTIRFINQFSTGYGDYVQEREQMFKDLSLDEIINRIKNP